MSNAVQVTRRRENVSTRDSRVGHAAVIEFSNARLPAVTSRKSAAAPAYTVLARVLHWVTALVIVLMIPLGVMIANDWGGRLQDALYGLHELLGVLLIPLVMARLIHRLTNPPSPLPHSIPALQRFAAQATHVGLYALLVVQPLVGWVATSASGTPITVLGLIPLPLIAPEGRVLSEKLFMLHDLIGIVVAGLVAAHVGAALYHHVIRKDRILMRMITG